LVGVVFVMVVLGAMLAVAVVVETRSHAAAINLGVFRGSGSATQVADYEQWLGHPVNYVLDYVGQVSDGEPDLWKYIDNPGWWCRAWNGSGHTPVFSVAILPNHWVTLEAGAGGTYDAHWRTFASAMIAAGCSGAILRLGWEFNGTFYPWAAGGHEAAFAAYWRHIVDATRSVGGHFRFDWCPLAGNINANVGAAYPGDGYVDYIGLDAYDESPVHTSPQDRWNDEVDHTYGLAWHASFAARHNKPMTFPEWGVSVRTNDNLGGGDNPYYINQMYHWITSHPVAYALYFEVNATDASHRLMTTEFPNSATEFRKMFATTG